jgi:hypothetical protein
LAVKDIPAMEAMISSGMGDQAMDIDRQRIAAVRVLEALGYSYRNNEWLPPAAVAEYLAEADQHIADATARIAGLRAHLADLERDDRDALA